MPTLLLVLQMLLPPPALSDRLSRLHRRRSPNDAPTSGLDLPNPRIDTPFVNILSMLFDSLSLSARARTLPALARTVCAVARRSHRACGATRAGTRPPHFPRTSFRDTAPSASARVPRLRRVPEFLLGLCVHLRQPLRGYLGWIRRTPGGVSPTPRVELQCDGAGER